MNRLSTALRRSWWKPVAFVSAPAAALYFYSQRNGDSSGAPSLRNVTRVLANDSATIDSLPQQGKRHITLWIPPSRQETINCLQGKTKDGEALAEAEQEYDLLIIGGGATGTGVALDAASRGLKVALVERDDFASGTSSRSTKLVHGGVRYLEKAFWNFDIEQYKLVEEALSERHTVLKIAPYLTTQLPIMCPIYKWWQLVYYYVGVKAYDLVAGGRGLESSYFLTRNKALQEFPMLKSDNLIGAIVYYDGQQNDSRMNTALALTAAHHGAVVANHVEVVSLHKKEETATSGQPPQLCGAQVRDMLTGETWNIRAKGIINATGPFTDHIRKMDDPSCRNIIAPSAGTHIVLPHYYSPDHMGLIDPATSDGRVIFFLPWEGNAIAGTTDAPTEITYDPKPTEEEIQFILNEVSHYLCPEIKVRRGDVLAAWSGIRPLVRNPNAANTAELVRNHLIHVSPSGLLTVAGGKWTTYRKMAEEAVDQAITSFGRASSLTFYRTDLKPRTPCRTEDILLIGSHGYNPRSYIELIQHFGMETEVAQHLVHNYGDRALAVAALASNTNQRWPLMGKRLAYPYLFIEAEVRYACQREYACTASDVLARRTRLAFLNAQAAFEALPRVVEIMAEELKWGDERQKKEFEAAYDFLLTMGLNPASSRSNFRSDEVIRFREEFRALDGDKDGVVGLKDLNEYLRKQGGRISDENVQRIIADVDLNKNGVVDFNEFLEIMMASADIRATSPFARLIEVHQDVPLKKPISTERSGGGV